MNISSIIMKTKVEKLESVIENLNQVKIGEIHFVDREKGIIILTIEGKNVEEEIEKVRELEELPNVISADMHMSYCEEELEEMSKDIDFDKAVKDMNSGKSIEEINYYGSLKGKY